MVNPATGLWADAEVVLREWLTEIARKVVLSAFEHLEGEQALAALKESKRLKDTTVNEAIRRIPDVMRGADRDERVVEADMRDLDLPGRYLGTASGVVDLETGSLLHPEEGRKHKVTRSTGVRLPDEGEDEHEGVEALMAHYPTDVAAYVWRWFGRSLWGQPPQEFLMFVGSARYGHKGKTTIKETMLAAMGGYAGTFPATMMRPRAEAGPDSRSSTCGREEAVDLRGVHQLAFRRRAFQGVDRRGWGDLPRRAELPSDSGHEGHGLARAHGERATSQLTARPCALETVALRRAATPPGDSRGPTCRPPVSAARLGTPDTRGQCLSAAAHRRSSVSRAASDQGQDRTAPRGAPCMGSGSRPARRQKLGAPDAMGGVGQGSQRLTPRPDVIAGARENHLRDVILSLYGQKIVHVKEDGRTVRGWKRLGLTADVPPPGAPAGSPTSQGGMKPAHLELEAALRTERARAEKRLVKGLALLEQQGEADPGLSAEVIYDDLGQANTLRGEMLLPPVRVRVAILNRQAEGLPPLAGRHAAGRTACR